MSARRASRGFTLIELLVVVAIIAVLMSILLPSLRAARESARAVVCGQKLRDLGSGLQTYFAENNEWIPGVNTSGVKLRSVVGMLNEYYNPRMPVQSFDWITPIMSPSTEMKAQRADRFAEIINDFMCPSQRFYKSIIWPGASINGEEKDFGRIGDWYPLSYLMPAHFQWWGLRYIDKSGNPNRIILDTHKINSSLKIAAKTPDEGWEVEHETYKSNLQQVGDPARKIAAADGTRYLDEDVLDFDPSPDPRYFGSFTSTGAYWAGSVAYGVAPNTMNASGRKVSVTHSPGKGKQLELSYRHGLSRGTASGSAADNKGMINAMFFDGSVRRLNDSQSRNPVLWYPKGSVVQSWTEGMIDLLKNGDVVP